MMSTRNVFEGVYPDSDYRPAHEPSMGETKAEAIAEGELLGGPFRAVPFGNPTPREVV